MKLFSQVASDIRSTWLAIFQHLSETEVMEQSQLDSILRECRCLPTQFRDLRSVPSSHREQSIKNRVAAVRRLILNSGRELSRVRLQTAVERVLDDLLGLVEQCKRCDGYPEYTFSSPLADIDRSKFRRYNDRIDRRISIASSAQGKVFYRPLGRGKPPGRWGN